MRLRSINFERYVFSGILCLGMVLPVQESVAAKFSFQDKSENRPLTVFSVGDEAEKAGVSGFSTAPIFQIAQSTGAATNSEGAVPKPEADTAAKTEKPDAAADGQSSLAEGVDPLAGPNAKKTGITVPTNKPLSILTGFRSAKFGMTEKQIRAAIVEDFGKNTRIFSNRSPVERTRSLTVRVPDVLPSGGVAQVSYVLGFRSKVLIQVGIVWSKGTDKNLKTTDLADNGALLKRHFITAGYEPKTVQVDTLVNGGLMLFRGEDKRGHAAMLLLQGKVTGGDKPELKPDALALIYSLNPDNPDVLKIKKSDF